MGQLIEIPAFIWTPDELCQLRFGADYYSPMLSSICSNIICRSLSDPYNIQLIQDATGMICNPGSVIILLLFFFKSFPVLKISKLKKKVCIDQNTCIQTKNAPPIAYIDKMVGNMTCQDYLNVSNASYAKSFCQDIFGLSRCPISCQSKILFHFFVIYSLIFRPEFCSWLKNTHWSLALIHIESALCLPVIAMPRTEIRPI